MNQPDPVAWRDDPELRLYRDSVRRFVRERFVPRQPEWRAAGRPDAEAWLDAGRAGLLLPDIPAEYGGGGGSYAHECVVIEELARAGVAFGSGVQTIVAHYLLDYADEERKRDWLPRLARGELVAAIAMTEPGAGSDLSGLRTTATRDGDVYVVDGAKTFITNGATAGLLCLAARTSATAPGPRAVSMLVAETAGLRGCRAGKPLDKIGLHGRDTCELFFDAMRVPAAGLLGGAEGRGVGQMMQQLPDERLSIAVAGLAMAEAAVEETTRYARERRIGDKPLFELQNTRFQLAECAADLRVGRAFVDACVTQRVAGRLDAATAAVAKLWVTERQCRIIDTCLQLHGGYGYMEEYPIARMWADSRAQRIYGGSSEVMKEIIAWSL